MSDLIPGLNMFVQHASRILILSSTTLHTVFAVWCCEPFALREFARDSHAFLTWCTPAPPSIVDADEHVNGGRQVCHGTPTVRVHVAMDACVAKQKS
eukprot:m.44761 g.44761  ORF g.44761 m.44761 type:complete len:97 (-) comp15102_c0_seq1:73-363(-)